MLRLALTLALFCMIVPAVPTIEATTIVHMTLEEMADASPSIVHGRVVSAQSRWNEDRTMILTDVVVRVESSLKGGEPGSITLTQLGGRVGALRVDVPGAVPFKAGEEAVLFLAPDDRGRMMVNGLSQGRFDVVETPAGKKLIRGLTPERVNSLRAAGALPAGMAAAAEASGDVPLDAFLTGVRGMLQIKREGGER
jgi:hypothetical protein